MKAMLQILQLMQIFFLACFFFRKSNSLAFHTQLCLCDVYFFFSIRIHTIQPTHLKSFAIIHFVVVGA